MQDKTDKLNLANVELEEMQSELEIARDNKNLYVQEKDELEKEVEPIRELQKLKTKTVEINIPDKPVFGNNVKIPYEDLLKLKEMADSYIANAVLLFQKENKPQQQKTKTLPLKKKLLTAKRTYLKTQ